MAGSSAHPARNGLVGNPRLVLALASGVGDRAGEAGGRCVAIYTVDADGGARVEQVRPSFDALREYDNTDPNASPLPGHTASRSASSTICGFSNASALLMLEPPALLDLRRARVIRDLLKPAVFDGVDGVDGDRVPHAGHGEAGAGLR